MLTASRVMVLAPHTDDAELGCGGSVAKFLDQGASVHCVAFSHAERSVPSGWPNDILKREFLAACDVLGIPKENQILLDFPVRDFPEHRQAILDEMVALNRDIAPDVVFMPATDDTHQDHQTIRNEGYRAFKHSTVCGYELPWNNIQFRTNFINCIGLSHLQRKIAALAEYHSQQHRAYTTPDFIQSLARVRGVTVGQEYAEAFELIRLVER